MFEHIQPHDNCGSRFSSNRVALRSTTQWIDSPYKDNQAGGHLDDLAPRHSENFMVGLFFSSKFVHAPDLISLKSNLLLVE